MSATAERGDDFARLTGVYANWRDAHPDATMPLDFIAAYLNGGTDSALTAPKNHAINAQARTDVSGCSDYYTDFDFIEGSTVLAPTNATSCFFTSLYPAGQSASPVSRGPVIDQAQTFTSPTTTITFKKGSIELGRISYYWRAVQSELSAPTQGPGPARFHTDATVHVTELRYLSSVKLDAMARAYAFPDSARFKLEATQAGLGVVNAPPAAPQETYLSYRNGFAGGIRQAGP